MTKNTAYYKAAFAKSEAASPYAKMNPHMKKDKTHMMAHHGDTSMKMGHKSHMEKHPGHMKMAGKTHMKGKVKGEGTHDDHHKEKASGKFLPADPFEQAIEKIKEKKKAEQD